ncbi:SRPBCC family protein, partial [Nocardia sp. CC201C]|uniref:type II toxin-antitoxin system Rv0910 family toxin n=1 Tax=Nocardia sp. CC201C TaxID=3044575 RepID=UPI0024A8D524
MTAVPGFDRFRMVRKQIRAGGELLGAVRRDPRIVRDLIAGLTGTGERPQPPVDDGAYTPPDGLAAFARTAQARQSVEVSARQALDYLVQLDRIPEWMAFHAGWRGDPPGTAEPGLEFTQQARFMGIPADLDWTVAAVTATRMELRGTGPQGLRLTFWVTVVPAASGALVAVDAGLAGAPIDGPLGGSVARSLGDALRDSLGALPAILADAAPAKPRVARKAVRHQASDTVLAPTTPVLVGVG